jgi:hypothetical protein
MTEVTTATDIHAHLLELRAERALATIEGIAVNSVCLRAELSGPQVG